MNKSALIRRIANTAFLLLGLYLLYNLFSKQDLNALGERFKTIRWWMLFLPVIFSFSTFWIRAYRWKLIMKPLGFEPKLSSSYHAITIGYVASLVVPRLGEVSRCFAMRTMEKLPFTPLLGTMIVARVADTLFMGFFLFLTALIYGATVTDFISVRLWEPFSASLSEKISANFNLLLLIAAIAVAGLIAFIFLLRRSAFTKKFKGLVQQFNQGLMAIFKGRDQWKILLLSAAIWLCYLGSFTSIIHAFPISDQLTWYDGLLPLMFTSIAMMAPVQGGIGAYHWMGTQAFIILGLTYTDGLAITTLVHLFAIGIMAIAGVVSLRMQGLSIFDNQKMDEAQAG